MVDPISKMGCPGLAHLPQIGREAWIRVIQSCVVRGLDGRATEEREAKKESDQVGSEWRLHNPAEVEDSPDHAPPDSRPTKPAGEDFGAENGPTEGHEGKAGQHHVS